MKLLDRMSNGWQLAKTSLAIIEKEKSLLLFPVLSSISLVLVCISFFGGSYLLFGEQLSAIGEVEGENMSPLFYVIGFAFYFINYFVIIFFNAALVHCSVKVLNGERANVSEGIRYAIEKIDKILMWAGIAATVGILLKALQKNDTLGRLAAGLLGTAWTILTFFVVPVLLYEDKNVIDSIKESGRVMQKKWGESLGADFSFGFIYLLGFLAIGVCAFVLGTINVGLGVVVGIALILLFITVMSAANTVFRAAIYQRANGLPIGVFNEDVLDGAFVPSKMA